MRAPNFLGIYYGGTGSSWLLNTLASSPRIMIAGYEPLEWMHWKVDEATRLAWVRIAWNPPERPDRVAMAAWYEELATNPQYVDTDKPNLEGVGFKMSAPAIENHRELLRIADESESIVLAMVRRNRVKHALSLYRAHEEDKHQFHDQGLMEPSTIAPRTFRKWLRQSSADHEAAMTFVAKARSALGADRVVEIAYEDFVDDAGKASTVASLADVFGLDAATLSYSKYRKSTPDSLSDAITNYEQLARQFRSSKYRDDFS